MGRCGLPGTVAEGLGTGAGKRNHSIGGESVPLLGQNQQSHLRNVLLFGINLTSVAMD